MSHMLENIALALRHPLRLLEYSHAYFFYQCILSALFGVPRTQICKLYRELFDSEFFARIAAISKSPVGFGHLSMLTPFRAPALYIITRLVKPNVVVETGVADGFSSSFILYALEVNQKGGLFSIDLPNQPGHMILKETGWLVPQALRSRWELIIGSSREKLLPLCERLQKVDVFWHDSDHSYENMMFEFNCVWGYLPPQGVLLVDDITDNRAFKEFTGSRQSKSASLFKLGIAIKNAKK